MPVTLTNCRISTSSSPTKRKRLKPALIKNHPKKIWKTPRTILRSLSGAEIAVTSRRAAGLQGEEEVVQEMLGNNHNVHKCETGLIIEQGQERLKLGIHMLL